VRQLTVLDPHEGKALDTPEDWPNSLQLVGSLELGNVVILEALWERFGMG
jgi:hypothetical protein